jgi:hypothetical protein
MTDIKLKILLTTAFGALVKKLEKRKKKLCIENTKI